MHMCVSIFLYHMFFIVCYSKGRYECVDLICSLLQFWRANGGGILVCSRCYKNTTDGVAYKPQKFIFQDFGAWEVQAQGAISAMCFKTRSLNCTVSTWPDLTSRGAGTQASPEYGYLSWWEILAPAETLETKARSSFVEWLYRQTYCHTMAAWKICCLYLTP